MTVEVSELQRHNIARIRANSVHFGHSALVAAVALDLTAPIAGRRWIPLCWRCLDGDRFRCEVPDELVVRVSHRTDGDAGHCAGCELHNGPDVFAVSVRASEVS